MSALGRPHDLSSTQLVMRILERPGLVAAVRELPGAVLGKLIDRIGLEDAGELIALASTAQLERIFDDDLWQAERAGGDETFQPERFALWLRVMLEGGEEALAKRLCELPQDLVALAFHRLVLVLDMDVLAEQLGDAGEEAEPIERALEASAFEEWEELRVIARVPDAWDDAWTALMSLDRDHHERLRAVLEQCCAMSTEYISGQGGLYQVLTSHEMLEGDVAAGRDDRRAAEGYISPADARAFLELARRGGGEDERDAITRAYFRGLNETGGAASSPRRGPQAARPSTASSTTSSTDGEGGRAEHGRDPRARPTDSAELAALLSDAGVTLPASAQPLAALALAPDGPGGGTATRAGDTHVAAPRFEAAMSALRTRAPERFQERVRELGYLVNVWLAGGAHEGRRPQPGEALEAVLAACEAGLLAKVGTPRPSAEQAVAVLAQTPADSLFRRGFRRPGPSRR